MLRGSLVRVRIHVLQGDPVSCSLPDRRKAMPWPGRLLAGLWLCLGSLLGLSSLAVLEAAHAAAASDPAPGGPGLLAQATAEAVVDAAIARRAALERPDDPPAPPRRITRTSPGARPRVGAFVSVQVNVDAGGFNIVGDAANEPSIAVDPTNRNRIVIGWRQFDSVLSNFRQAGYAFSHDGGRTWTFPGVLEPGVFRSDPVLGVASDGSFYYTSLKVVGNQLTCDVFRSFDAGLTWLSPVFAHGGDKEWIAVDQTGTASNGHFYMTWSTAAACCGLNTFTRSTNGVGSFEAPLGVPSNPQWGTMDVGPDGTLFLCGLDPSLTRWIVNRSTSARDPLALTLFESSVTVDMGGAVGVFGGVSSPNPDGLLGQTWIAVDPSNGVNSNTVYMLASVDPPGSDPLDVHFVRSTDAGVTWSTPVRVNDDPGTLAWQWFGTMSVAPNGRIDVVWNDTRNTGSATLSELFYAFSTDGGLTWSPNQQLSPVWNSHFGFPSQNKIGDYYHMISDDVGASLAWAATFNGEQDVYYLRIGDTDCNGNAVGDSTDIASGTSLDLNLDGIPDECQNLSTSDVAGAPRAWRLGANVPNPFNPGTTLHFDAPQGGGHARLRIFDVAGRLVRTLVDDRVAAGPHTASWDGRDDHGRTVATGVYLARLEAGGFSATRRLVLVQ